MTALYIQKVESILQRALTNSERATAAQFLTLGYSASYTAEYLK